MDYLKKIHNNIKLEIKNIPKYVNEKIIADKDKIVSLNINQISRHENSLGGILESNIKMYNGYYAYATEHYFAKYGIPTFPITTKTTGRAYNFNWSGSLFRGFDLKIHNQDYEIFSHGTKETKGKEIFINSYPNFFGLKQETEDVILKEVYGFCQNKLLNKIYNGK
jgi:hypothetical protein